MGIVEERYLFPTPRIIMENHYQVPNHHFKSIRMIIVETMRRYKRYLRHCGPTHSGQPTELALLVGASKVGLEDPRPLYHRIQEVTFSSDRKRMKVRARPVGGTHICDSFRNASTSIILPNSSSPSPNNKTQTPSQGKKWVSN